MACFRLCKDISTFERIPNTPFKYIKLERFVNEPHIEKGVFQTTLCKQNSARIQNTYLAHLHSLWSVK